MNVMPFGPGWGQAKRTAVSGPSPVSDLLYQSFYDTLPGAFTFTRASSAWGFNSAGVLTQFANDVSRQVYDPVTLAAQGTLVEPTSSNQIANPRMEGATAPSTFPTGSGGYATNGLTRSVVGIGYDDGLPYLDMRISGTTTAAALIGYLPTQATTIAALTGQTWTFSTFLRVVGGALGTPDFVRISINEMTSGGVFVTGWYVLINPTAAPLRTQQNSYTRTLSGGATVAAVQPGIVIQYPTGTVVDVTLRIGLPQMEQLGWASSPIMPPAGSPAVSTRAAEALALALPFAGFPGAVGWSAMMEFMPTGLPGNVAAFRLTGSAGNFSAAQVNGSANVNAMKSVGGTNIVSSATSTGLTVGVPIKLAMAQDTADLRLSLGGSAIVASANAGYPAMDMLDILPAQPGTVRRLQLWPRELSDAELQGVTP